MTEQHTWRRATQEDEIFLLALFSTQQRAEFELLGLSPQELEPLVAMQYQARRVRYAQAYPAAIDMILCRLDGTPVGRQLIERQSDAYRLIDLAISPEVQNRGIGSWAIRKMQRLAAAENLLIRLSVLRSNSAFGWYTRLGFLPSSCNETAYEMEWQSRLPLTSAIANGPKEQRA